MTLEILNKNIRKCKKCGLWKTRKNAVPGEGKKNAKIMIIGQAPGKREDETGRPFVGRAGKLLNEVLASSNIKRSETFITSVLKCFPPKNRLPRSDETKACMPYLEKQINLIRPKRIILLGKVAVEAVLKRKVTLREIHGKTIRKQNILYLPTYHPAAALRFPRFRKTIEKDIQRFIHS